MPVKMLRVEAFTGSSVSSQGHDGGSEQQIVHRGN